MRLLWALFLVVVGAEQGFGEFRGAWIATVHNINFPSRPGLPVEVQKREITQLLDAAQKVGLNSVLFQVRPESDALYESALEPWSRYLTGSQGISPGYDPLAFCISEARQRGIKVHAWLNPYRAVASAGRPVASNHISRRLPQFAYRVGGVVYMDPGAGEVRAQILRVVQDLLARYDLGGIHFDDYFYPYPDQRGKLPIFPDDATYAAYRVGGGRLSRADWRRENVNRLIWQTGQLVRQMKPGAVFGVSPFGIYTRGQPEGVVAGVDQYNQLFSDPVRWMREGWLDYLAPQLYWPVEGRQSFDVLLRWWRSPSVNPRRVPIYPGIAVDRLRTHGWPVSEIGQQLDIERRLAPRVGGGFLLWNIGAVKSDTKGVVAVLRSRR